MTKTTKPPQAIITLMAVSGGVIIANIYYNQPILKEIGLSLNASGTAIGKISMLAQLGFGLGMFFLLPLGDKLNRKNLIILLTSMLAVFLVMFTMASTVTEANILSFLIGVCATPTQIILPMAATLDSANRGKTVGQVFGGILVGILGARVLSGFLSDLLGWHAIYRISAGMVTRVANSNFLMVDWVKMREFR